MVKKDRPKQQGKIIVPAGVLPERHGLETANFLAKFGKDVEFQVPNRTKGAKTPDILMDGVLREMKCIFGKSRKTIRTALDRAGKRCRKAPESNPTWSIHAHLSIRLCYTLLSHDLVVVAQLAERRTVAP
jgi:hypothetical protein